MATYKVTNKTKKIIKRTAFELFWKYDYEQVTCAQIAQSANVKLGTLTYHFAKKELLYQEYIIYLAEYIYNECNRIVPEQLKGNKIAEYIMAEGVYLYNEIYCPNYLNAIVQGTDIFYDLMDHISKEYFREYLPDTITDKEAFIILTGWDGIACGIARMLYQNPEVYTFEEVYAYLIKTIFGPMLNIEKDRINELYRQCVDVIFEQKPVYDGDFSKITDSII